MPVRDYPKHVKKALREWSAEAHERELHRELALLDRSFDQWRSGKIGSGELSARIHAYEMGPSRELYKRYNSGLPDVNVASALAEGILTREEMPADVVEAIENLLNFYQ